MASLSLHENFIKNKKEKHEGTTPNP